MMGLTSILKFKFDNKILIIKPPILILILNIKILYPYTMNKKINTCKSSQNRIKKKSNSVNFKRKQL